VPIPPPSGPLVGESALGLVSVRRAAAWTTVAVVLTTALASSANAQTPVSSHLHRLHQVELQIREARSLREHQLNPLARAVHSIDSTLKDLRHAINGPDTTSPVTDIQYVGWTIWGGWAHTALNHLNRRVHHQLPPLLRRRRELENWLNTVGIFRRCPVTGWTSISNDFGAIVHIPHVKPHPHMGNDIGAPFGSPIVAPFDGYASTTNSKLGGLGVRVWGPLGHVYNAHLSAYGKLGDVTAGDVIGYVGITGDAGGPHDHFEWHPNDGWAVDPHSFLAAACG
jgi:murein DD-endopeptidase MepM/ murein hydrolase activator NlpD